MKRFFTDNLSYKVVAFGVALVLWSSLTGRRDSTMVKEYQLRLLLAENMEVTIPPPKFIYVEIVGPRVTLKKIFQSTGTYTVDLTDSTPGPKQVEFGKGGIELPTGARVQSIQPEFFRTELRRKGESQ